MEPSSLATKQVAAFIERTDSFLEAATCIKCAGAKHVMGKTLCNLCA